MSDGASISPDAALRRRTIVVIVIAAALYLVGNDRIHLWDRDEPRYAQTSRQMVQSGDWVVPRFLGQIRTAKPVLIYWCQAAAMTVFGDTPFAARLPSAIAMVLTLAMLAWVLRRELSPEHAFWTITILASSMLVVSAAKMCLTDAVLLLWITMGQICLYAMWRGRGTWGVTAIYGASMGLAILTKGPVILGVQAMTLVALCAMWAIDRWLAHESLRATSTLRCRTGVSGLRDSSQAGMPVPPVPDRSVRPTFVGRTLPSYIGSASAGCTQPAETIREPDTRYPKPETPNARPDPLQVAAKALLALAIIAAIVAPWVCLIQKRAPEFLQTTLSHDVLKRMQQPLEGHKGPPGFYLATIWGTFLPWSLFLPTAIWLAIKNRRNPLLRFALASVIGPWVMFEIVRTKLPHYLLPVFPPLALLTVDALVRCFRGGAKLVLGRFTIAGAAIWAIAMIALGAAPWVATLHFKELPYVAMVTLSAVATIYALWVFALLAGQRLERAAKAMAGGLAAVLFVFFAWYLPQAWFCQLPQAVAKVLENAHASSAVGDVIMIDYKEPSLAFYQGGTIREESRSLRLIPFDQIPPWVVISGRDWAKCDPALKSRFEAIGPMRAWSYADEGKVMDVYVLRKRGL